MNKRVVVLGGGSTGEAFVAAVRRLDEEVSITLVEQELVERRLHVLGLHALEDAAAPGRARRCGAE